MPQRGEPASKRTYSMEGAAHIMQLLAALPNALLPCQSRRCVHRFLSRHRTPDWFWALCAGKAETDRLLPEISARKFCTASGAGFGLQRRQGANRTAEWRRRGSRGDGAVRPQRRRRDGGGAGGSRWPQLNDDALLASPGHDAPLRGPVPQPHADVRACAHWQLVGGWQTLGTARHLPH